MPIYEYLCQSCAHRFEVKQKLSDAPIERCVRCGETVRKVISAPAIMFKGTGWYVTDYSDKLKAPGESAAGNGQGEAKPGAADGSKEKKDQQAPATGTATESSSSGSAKPETAPVSGGSSGGSSGSSGSSGAAPATTSSSPPKPSGSSS